MKYTKEELRERNRLYQKKWREKNRDKDRESTLKWTRANVQRNRDKVKEHYYNVYKDGTYKVYCLPNADYYVGQTSTIRKRMNEHNRNGNDSNDYIILHECDTKQEALWYESFYHKLGFRG